jgi:hypothetical protein
MGSCLDRGDPDDLEHGRATSTQCRFASEGARFLRAREDPALPAAALAAAAFAKGDLQRWSSANPIAVPWRVLKRPRRGRRVAEAATCSGPRLLEAWPEARLDVPGRRELPQSCIFFPLSGGTEMSLISLRDRSIAEALGRNGRNISTGPSCSLYGRIAGLRSAFHGIPILKNRRRACRCRSNLACSENSIVQKVRPFPMTSSMRTTAQRWAAGADNLWDRFPSEAAFFCASTAEGVIFGKSLFLWRS